MRNKMYFLGIVAFLLAGTAGLNMLYIDRYMPPEQKQNIIIPKNEAVQDITGAYNEKEGWGFVKSRNGKTPEVTAHQIQLVKKYGALFVGDTGKKQVTITFDLGYEKQGLTPKVLEILRKHNIKASFFVTTHWIEQNPELAREVVQQGHVLGNHTVKHKSLPTLSDEEVRQEIQGWEKVALREADYKIKHKYMRPPMGEYSERTLKITRELGYITAFWSVAIRDWLPMGGPGEAIRGVTQQIHNGAVILLHGNSEDVVNGLDQIIKEIRKKGYKIVPIYEIRNTKEEKS